MNHIFQLYSDNLTASNSQETEPEYFRRVAADRARQLRAERRRRLVRTLTGRRPAGARKAA
jgi:hypothetical protein